MLSEIVKTNLNRIDFELKELYSNVKISEKNTHNKFFFQIEAVGNFQLFESNQSRQVKSLVLIEKNNLNFEKIKWQYCINPSNPNSDFIDRVSNVDELTKDIYETVTKKKMDISYLKSTPVVYEMINENLDKEVGDKTIEDEIFSIVEKFEIQVEDINTENINGRRYLKIYHNGLKVSDKFKLESKINELDGVNFVSFTDDFIKINLNI